LQTDILKKRRGLLAHWLKFLTGAGNENENNLELCMSVLIFKKYNTVVNM